MLANVELLQLSLIAIARIGGQGWDQHGGEGTGTWEQCGGYVSTRESMKATYTAQYTTDTHLEGPKGKESTGNGNQVYY